MKDSKDISDIEIKTALKIKDLLEKMSLRLKNKDDTISIFLKGWIEELFKKAKK